ncbi:ABC transporter substrate binding protein [Curvivirga aplysinae]|uniref:ABC transporter substrate binding protein n=1 Tax=Curvivirga aplysinae TaxID=2529852 RepID=UPI001C3FC8D5|nr:ABC transporter substrate binding protein [Curvivirga aplysinae]
MNLNATTIFTKWTAFRLLLCLSMFIFPLSAQANTSVKLTDWFAYQDTKTVGWTFDVIDTEHIQITRDKSLATTPATPSANVMVIYRKKSSAYDIAISQVLKVFEQRGVNAEFNVVFIGKDVENVLSALQTAESNNVDLLVSMGSSTTRSLLRNYSNGKIPVVTVTSKDPVLMGQLEDYQSGSGTNVAFTSLNASAETLFQYLLRLNPDVQNLAILYAEQNESAVLTQFQPMKEISGDYNIQIFDIGVKNRDDAANELQMMLPNAINRMKETDPDLSKSMIWLTGSTSVFQQIRLINELAQDIPVLSAVTNVVKEGEDSAVVSIGIGFESNAHLAAIYMLDILNGANPGEMPVGVVTPPDIAINFRIAHKIGMKIPFDFLEIASFVYDKNGNPVRVSGQNLF